jgi:hypothetical protein
MFSLDDLFFVGVALDITGAAFLAKGLLVPPETIYGMVQTTFDGMAPGAAEGHIRNKVDAEFGLFFLLVGFILQALGYLFELAGHGTSQGDDRAGVALVLGLLAAFLAIGIYAALHGRRYRRIAAQVRKLGEEAQDRYEETQKQT